MKNSRMSVIDKAKIIEAIQQTEDERILFAINRLLQIAEDEMPEWRKSELDKRIHMRRSGEMEIYDWDDMKEEIKSTD